MRHKIQWFLQVVLLSLVLGQSATAYTVTYFSQIPYTATDWNLPETLPKFDPDMGTLKEVRISVESCCVFTS